MIDERKSYPRYVSPESEGVQRWHMRRKEASQSSIRIECRDVEVMEGKITNRRKDERKGEFHAFRCFVYRHVEGMKVREGWMEGA